MAHECYVIVKNYEHFNKSLPNWNTPKGVYVKNKAHYEELMKQNNMVSFEEAQEIAEKARLGKIKPYQVSKDSLDLIRHAQNSKDKHGNVKLSDRAVDYLVKKKAIGQKVPEYMKLPSHYQEKGGFTK